jgi:hypothetical protein
MNSAKIGVCALCQQYRELRNSHFLPKALYRLVRDHAHKNPHPFLLSANRREQTSKQATHHLLCDECEKRFDRNGEDWVLKHCYRGRGVFRLRKLLEQSAQIESGSEALVYSASAVPGIDTGQLVYFCTSVFWRASLRAWTLSDQKYEALSLGNAYQEEMRKYLLSEASFPRNAVVTIILSHLKTPVLAYNFPDSLRLESCHCHRLHIPGVTFMLMLGKQAPQDFGQICVFRSPVRPIYVSKHGDALVQTALLALIGKIKTPRSNDSVLEGYESLV